MSRRHIFLDLDGTLTDPSEGIIRSIVYALESMGRPVPPPESLTQYIGPPLGAVFQGLLLTDEDRLIQIAIGAYRDRFATVGIRENRLYPGIVEALGALAQAGSQLSVVTAKPRIYAEQIVEHFGIGNYFAAIHGPELEDIHADKASLIGRALTHGSSPSSAVMMVGDRRDDIVGARANGIGVIAVAWGFGTREELQSADHIVATPSELVTLVTEGNLRQ